MPEPAVTPRGSPCADAAAATVPAGVRPRAGRLERALVAAAMAFVVWFYHWTVDANTGFADWGDMDYFKLLVRGWKKGQLNMDIAPAPELLALADPYDPEQNLPYKLGDASLYKGKYYIYFGPAPAFTVMLPYALLTGREMTMGTATFVFCVVAFVTASGLWLALRRRYFPGSRPWVAPLGVLALGFGTHLLALAQRPMIWELAISGGVAFTLLAMVAVYRALHGPRPLVAMAFAGLCVGLAVGSRPTSLFAAGMLAVPVWQAWRTRRGPAWWKVGLAAAVPLGLCGLAIMAHNYARFDHPLEWGQNYQLSGAYERKLTHFSLRFLPHNFSVYLFQLLRWTAEFPFARAVGIEISHIPDYFGTEEVAGLAVTFPFFWLILALPLAWWRRDDATRAAWLAAVLGVAVAVVPVMALVMCYFSTTTRYQTDFAVGLALLALLGLLAVERWLQQRAGPWPRRALAGAAGLATGATVLVGVLMSFDYHNRSMLVTSPDRWHALDARLHLAVVKLGQLTGSVEGPQVLKVRFAARPAGTVENFWIATDPAAAERILVEHIGEGLIRFGFRRGEGAVAWGRPLKWETNHTHTVSVQLPSLYPEPRDGWWAAVQRRSAFRQRSSAAVWFSGGRALGLIVPPLAAGFRPGGASGPDFSGTIRDRFTRAFQPDEVEAGLVDVWARRGGILRMRVLFPDRLQEKGEPIYACGAHYRSSIVFVEAAPGGLRFVFENYSQPRVESPVFRPDPAGHHLELEMASFNPERFGEEATGDVVVRLDGREMMRTRQVAYPSPPGEEQIGRNPFGTTCAPEFRGWIHDARWSAGEAVGRAP